MNKVDVLDKGYVILREHMGSDLTIVDAARVSFDKRSDWEIKRVEGYDPPPGEGWRLVNQSCLLDGRGISERRSVWRRLSDKDRRLLRYLAREGHWSPFSHAVVQLEIKAPVMVVNQLYKHRVGGRFQTDAMDVPWNEMSGRYVSEDLEFYEPEVWRSAPENRKQGSGEPLSWKDREAASSRYGIATRRSIEAYEDLIELGVAPEQARVLLPYAAMYTKLMWTPTLMTVIRLLMLREDDDAQWEIRQYAKAIHRLVQPLFPDTFKVFGIYEEAYETGIGAT